MAEVLASQEKRDPLEGVSCGKSDCANGLHCFNETKRKASSLAKGVCAACGVAVSVDWERVRKMDLVDIDYTINALKKRWVSHLYWCEVEEIDEKALNHARRKGRINMRELAEKRIRNSVGKAWNFRDGGQTPWKGNVIFYAQHATATCCRKCIDYWYGIEFGRDLTEEEVQRLTALVVRYIEEKVQLTEEGEKIPYRRKKKQSKQPSVQGQNEQCEVN